MRMHQGRPVILFKGIASMDDAELLAGRELRIAESDGDEQRLREGEFYHRDLIGCEVVTEDGESIGQVTAVEGDRAATRLVVQEPAERSADSAGRRDLHGGRRGEAHHGAAAGGAAGAERRMAPRSGRGRLGEDRYHHDLPADGRGGPRRRRRRTGAERRGCWTSWSTTCATSRPTSITSWTMCRSAAGRGW